MRKQKQHASAIPQAWRVISMPNLKQFGRKIDRTFWFENFLFWAMDDRQHVQEHQHNFDGQHFNVEINQ